MEADAISKLNAELHDITSIPPDQQRLSFKTGLGHINDPEDGRTLSDYNIQTFVQIEMQAVAAAPAPPHQHQLAPRLSARPRRGCQPAPAAAVSQHHWRRGCQPDVG